MRMMRQMVINLPSYHLVRTVRIALCRLAGETMVFKALSRVIGMENIHQGGGDGGVVGFRLETACLSLEEM